MRRGRTLETHSFRPDSHRRCIADELQDETIREVVVPGAVDPTPPFQTRVRLQRRGWAAVYGTRERMSDQTIGKDTEREGSLTCCYVSILASPSTEETRCRLGRSSLRTRDHSQPKRGSDERHRDLVHQGVRSIGHRLSRRRRCERSTEDLWSRTHPWLLRYPVRHNIFTSSYSTSNSWKESREEQQRTALKLRIREHRFVVAVVLLLFLCSSSSFVFCFCFIQEELLSRSIVKMSVVDVLAECFIYNHRRPSPTTNS